MQLDFPLLPPVPTDNLWKQYTFVEQKIKIQATAGKTHDFCRKCFTKHSPEWRKGPLGRRTLCNKCGLRWARWIKSQGLLVPKSSQEKKEKPNKADLAQDPPSEPVSPAHAPSQGPHLEQVSQVYRIAIKQLLDNDEKDEKISPFKIDRFICMQ